MNREISNHYRAKIGSGLSKELTSEALFAAIRNEDIFLIRACRGKLPTNENEWEGKDEDMYPMRFALREMAHVSVLEALLDIGFALPSSPHVTPFSGKGEEIVSFLMKAKGIDRKEAAAYLIFSTSYYLDVFNEGCSCYRVPFRLNPHDVYEPGFFSYLNAWLIELIPFVKMEIDSSDKESRGNLSMICRVLAEVEGLYEALETYIACGLISGESIAWLMGRAVHYDNEKAFDLLLSIAPDGALDAITDYPRKNMRLLEKIFSLDLLTPGTDKAFEAFQYFISSFDAEHDNPEILKKIMHPSYAKRRDDSGNTILLFVAKVNDDFCIQNYPILAPTKEDMNARDREDRTIFYYFAAQEYSYCFEDLVEMGVDPYDTDGKGNSVLHIMMGKGGGWNNFADIADVMKVLPADIAYKKNNEGKTPLDLFGDILAGKAKSGH